MRVLVLSSHLFPNYKNPNAGSFVVEQVRHLSQHCDITVLVPHPWVPPLVDRLSVKWQRYATLPSEETIAGVRVLHPKRLVIPKINSWAWMTVSVTLSYWRFFVTQANNLHYDVLEGHFVLPDGFAAAFLGRRFNKPSLIHVHGTDVHTIPNESRLLRGLVRWALRNADGVRAVSQDLAQRCINLGATPGKVKAIPNGIDLSHFSPMPKWQAKAKVGLDPNRRHLIYVGRLVAVKGLDLLLDAAALVFRQRNDTDLVLVGDGPEKVVLQQRTKALGIGHRVHFICAQPHDRIPLWMNAGDALCLFSHKEGLPVVSIEALACGTPVVATAVGGIPEIVADGQVGRLVYSRDPEEAATRLMEVLDTNWDREKLRQHAMKFSYDRVTEWLLEMYGSIMRKE